MLLTKDILSARRFFARLVSPLAPAGASTAQTGKVRSGRVFAGIAVGGSPKIPGFTLVELMVTVAIVAILVTLGVPSFIDMVKNNRISGQANDFTTALMLARSEAVRRGSIVCVKSKGSEGNWSAGWNAFPEKAGETKCETVAGTIQTHDALSGGHTLTVGDPFKTYIRYNAMGVAVDANGAPAGSADFTLCRGTTAEDIAKSRLITISATGNPAIKVDSTTGSPKPPTSCP